MARAQEKKTFCARETLAAVVHCVFVPTIRRAPPPCCRPDIRTLVPIRVHLARTP